METALDKRKEFLLKISENYFNIYSEKLQNSFNSSSAIDIFTDKQNCYVLCIQAFREDIYISNKLPDKNNPGVVLVFYKIHPTVITQDNIRNTVLVCSVFNSPVNTLYQTLQKVFIPALFENQSDSLNIKLQTLVANLEAGLKTAVLECDSPGTLKNDQFSLSGILTVEDECNYWDYVMRTGDSIQIQKADNFLKLLRPISTRLSHLSKLTELEDFLEDAYNAFDDIWKLDEYRFPQQRMNNLLEIIGNGICQFIQDNFENYNIWESEYYEINEFLCTAIEACNKWCGMCNQLTTYFWPNYSLHKWSGESYSPSYLKQFVIRLNQIIEIRTVNQSLKQILTKNEQKEFNVAENFKTFAGINPILVNPYTVNKWNIAILHFEESLKPLEEQVGKRLKEQIRDISFNALQLLEWFKRYQDLIQLSGLKNILKPERHTLLVMCQEYLNNLSPSADVTQERNLVYECNDIPFVVGRIMWIEQLQTKVNMIQQVCGKITQDLNGYETLQQTVAGIKEELQTNRLKIYNQWSSDMLDAISSNKLCLKTDEPVVYFEDGKSMMVNYNPQLVKLIKEVRQLKLMKFSISPVISEVADLAQRFITQAKSLEQIASFHNTIGDRMVPSQRPMMLNTALQLSKLVKTQNTVTWSEINEVDRYIGQLQSVVDKLASENALLYSYHNQIMQKVIPLMSTDLLQQKNKWRDTLREIRDIIAEAEKKFNNTKAWRLHWDYQLYKALECQYQIGLENLNQYLPEIKVELVYRQHILQFSPTIEEIRTRYYHQLKKFLTIPCSFQGVSDSSSSIFPKMVEKTEHKYKSVYEKGEELFERLLALRNDWLDKIALGSIDLDLMIKENLKTAEDWDLNFRDCKSWGQEIAKIISCEHRIDCFLVSTAPVRSEIELHNQRYWDALSTSLYSSIMFDVSSVEKFLDEAERTLQLEPQTLDEIGNMNVAYSNIVESSEKVAGMVQEMDKKNKTLASWTKDRVAAVSKVKQMWSSFQSVLENQHYIIGRQVEGIKSKVLMEVENLMTEVDNFILRWKQIRPRETDIIDTNDSVSVVEGVLNILTEKRSEWNALLSNIEKIREDCRKFNVPFPVLPDQSSFESDLESCEDLWGLYGNFISGINDFGSEEWIVFRSKGIQKFEQFLQEWQEKLETKPTSSLLAKISKDVQSYKEFVPCIKFIRGDVFSDKHWSELYSIVGINFKSVDKLTLGDFLNVQNAVKDNISSLQELNSRATSEIVVRQALAELDIWELESKFSFVSHTDNKGQEIFLVKDFKDILNKIGDNQCLLQSITGSSNYDQFSDRTKLWETKLSDIDHYLRSISELQRKWLYLEPIFGNETMRIEKARFTRVDRDFRHILNTIVNGDHKVVSLCRISNLKQILDSSLQQLNICQKSLNEYLEEKRLQFPRFYFLSDEDLLEILGQSNKPEVVQSHLKKLFAGIHNVKFDKNYIISMNSSDGEIVALNNPIMISLDVEKWLNQLVIEMQNTLKELLISCLKNADPLTFPSQILCLAEEISFTSRCEIAVENGSLVEFRFSLEKQLDTYTSINLELSSDNESHVLELKLKALILDTVYHISIVEDLISNQVNSLIDWNWQRRVRHYLNKNGVVIIKMVDAEFIYSYEYQGNSAKLVQTPLTDKCYLTLTQAMRMGLGGNPYGPAGTGKTESVKALGKVLGRQVLVFNCDEGLDFHSLTRILIGLTKCGAWGCFDEFNRLEEVTLSAISMHIHSIQDALKNNYSTVTLQNKTVELDKNTGIFVTLNPAGRSYGGRQKLPDNLKQLFRPIAMSQPDDQLIAEVILYSEGFKTARILALKLVQIFRMCRKILSKQKHYDWGLRALKTVISGCRSALKAARQNSIEADTDETALIGQVLRLNTLSKLTFSDAVQFDNLIKDVFPGVSFHSSAYTEISQAIRRSFQVLGLSANERQVHKCLQLYEQLQQRMGVVVVGTSGAGKSIISKLLKQALVSEGNIINQYTINPKAIARTQLLGQIDLDTRRWIDGVLSTTAQKVYNEPSNIHSWVVFDGDVDPEWIESLNSVLDDNRLLTLPSGWRIQFGSNVHFVFETHSLDNASPATVSRMGIVLLNEEEDIEIRDIVDSWIQRQPVDQANRLLEYIENYFYKALDWIKSKGEMIVQRSIVAVVNNFLSLVSAVSSKTYFAMMLIAGLGSNLTLASKQAFANEVLQWTDEFIQETYNILNCYYNPSRDCIDIYRNDTDLNKQSFVVLTAQMKSVSDIISLWINKKEPFILIGPPGCGKSLLLNNCFNELYTFEKVTINCSSNITPYHILQKLSQMCMFITSTNGRIFRPKNSERVILHLKDLNLTKVDKWGSNMLVSFFQQVLTYGGFYDENQMDWIIMDQIHIICTLTSCESLSSRFINLNHIISLWPSEESDLTSICLAHIQSLALDSKLHTTLSSIIVKIYAKVKNTFSQEQHAHYLFTPRDLIRWSLGIKRYVTGSSSEEIIQCVLYEGNRLFEDRLATDEDKVKYRNIVSSVVNDVLSKSGVAVVNAVADTVFVWNESYAEPSLEKLNMKDWSSLLQRVVTQLENSGEYVEHKILLPELIKVVAYVERILTDTGSSLIMPSRSGYGRETIIRIVATRSSAHLICPKISHEYTLTNFKNDIKSVLQLAGIENQTVYYVLEDYQFVMPEILDYVSSLLGSGEIPELYQPDEFEALCAPLKDLASQNDFNGTGCQYFAQRVMNNLHIILVLDFTNPDYKTYLESNPVLLKKCHVIWLSNWQIETMKSIPNVILSSSAPFNDEKETNKTSPTTIIEDRVLNIAIDIHNDSQNYMNVTPRHFNLLIRSYLKIKKHKEEDIVNTMSKLKVGLSKLTEARSVVADLKSDAAQQETKLAEKQNKATTALELITKTMQNASTQRNEMEILKENVEKENVALTQRKEEIDSELAEIEPLLSQARAAVGNIKAEALSEIRSLRAPPDVIRDILEGVLRLMGIQDTSWNSMKTFLSKRGVKEEIRYFDARNIATDNRESVEELLQARAKSFDEKTAKRASTAAAPLASWVIMNVKYSQILEKILPLEKEQTKLQKKLKDAEDQITLLSTGLDNVDQTVAKLKEQLNVNTKEAAEIEVRLNKAKETISAAEGLVIKLDDEYSRWGEQLEELSKDLKKLPFFSLLSAASLTYLAGTTEQMRKSMVEQWQLKLNMTDFYLEQFLSSEQEKLKWISVGLPSDYLSLQNAVTISQICKLDSTTCNRPFLLDPAGNAMNWLKQYLSSQKPVEYITQRNIKFATTLELAIRFGKCLIVQDVTSVSPILINVLRANFIYQGTRKLIQIGEKLIDYNDNFELFLYCRDTNSIIPPNIAALLTTINFATTHTSLSQRLLRCALCIEKPDLENRQVQLLKKEEELNLKLFQLQDNILKQLVNAQGNILENKELLLSLNETKKSSTEIKSSLVESEKIREKLNKEYNVYMPLAENAATLYFSLQPLKEINNLYQISVNSFILIYNKIFSPISDSSVNSNIEDKKNKLIGLVYHYVSRFLFKSDRLTFALYLTRVMFPRYFNINEWELFTRQVVTNVKCDTSEYATVIPSWINKERSFDVFLLKESLPDLYSHLQLENCNNWSTFLKSGFGVNSFPVSLSPFQMVLVMQTLNPGLLHSALTVFSSNALGLNTLSPPTLHLNQLLTETSATVPILLILSPGADPSEELRSLATSNASSNFTEIALGQDQTAIALETLRESSKNGSWLILKNVHLVTSWLPILEKEFQLLTDVHSNFRLWLTSEPHAKFPSALAQLCLKITYEAPQGIKRHLQRSYNQLLKANTYPSAQYARTVFALAWFHAVVQERRTFIPQGWCKFYEFNDSDFLTALDIIRTRYAEGKKSINWDYLHGLCECAIYGGRIDNEQDLSILRSYLKCYFNADVINSGRQLLAPGLNLPFSTETKDYLTVMQKLSETDSPQLFSLPLNLNCLWQKIRSSEIISSVKILCQSTTKIDSNNIQEWKAAVSPILHLWKQLNQETGILKIKNMKSKRTYHDNEDPMRTFVNDELQFAFNTVQNMHKTLVDVSKALRSSFIPSESTKNLISSIVNQQTPENWLVQWDGSNNPSTYIRSVMNRASFIIALNKNVESGYSLLQNQIDLSSFFNSDTFLSVLKQYTARILTEPLDNLFMECSWKDDKLKNCKAVAHLSGLLVEGAYFNSYTISENLPDSPTVTAVPPFDIGWIPRNQLSSTTESRLQIPVYQNATRENLVTKVGVPIPLHEHDKWIQANVAFYLRD